MQNTPPKAAAWGLAIKVSKGLDDTWIHRHRPIAIGPFTEPFIIYITE